MISTFKVLDLYAGVGGNRKGWSCEINGAMVESKQAPQGELFCLDDNSIRECV